MYSKLPFLVHILIETPAAFTFIFTPDKQLQDVSPAARLITQQYGGLLIASNLICLVIIFAAGWGDVERMIGAALGFYHLWPCVRAWSRLRTIIPGDVHGKAALGGPAVHLVVHVFLLLLFIHVTTFPNAS